MTRSCEACGVDYEAKRPNARFCSLLCRKRASRNPALTDPESPPTDSPDGEVTRSTLARLTELEVVDDPVAAMAVALARRLDSPRETGSAMAQIAKQLATLLDVCEKRGRRRANPLDELRARRMVKSSA